MGSFSRLAAGWSVLNLALATRLPVQGDFPWIPVVLLAVLPLALQVFAEPIADSLRYGLMQRYASDRGQPQSPAVIKFMGWMLLALQTLFLVVAV